MATQFDRIYNGMSMETGKFRVATSGMAWKADTDTSKDVTAIHNENIKWVQWLRVARGFQLRVGLKDHTREKFDGFAREDHDKLATLMKNHFGLTLETIEVTFKGWNWGVADFHGEDLAFMVSDKKAFELPLRHVANSNIAGKTEVSLEFSNLTPPSKSGGAKQVGDELTEIRFFVPGIITKLKGSDQGSDKEDNEEEGEEEEISAAQVFHDTIKEKADIGAGTGDLILSFDEVLVLTPRGRYDMDMFPDFLRLRGKTYDYKVLYQSIARLFLLPKDDQQVLFILGLSTPIRQGQTLYQYLVMQFTREEEITAELNMTDEEIAKFDKLKKNYEDPTYEVVSSVFRALSGKKIIGSGSFQSRDGHPGFKANLKAIQGDLFMLERYIFFVSKSPLLIELSDIHQVVFSRVGSGSTAAPTGGRTFDIKIVSKSSGEYMFTSINKEEHEVTEAYLKDKKIRVKNEMVPDADLLLKAVGVDDDDDDDEDMQSVVSDDEEESDRGKRQKKPARTGGADDSEEEDEDFRASDSDSGSPSESDSDTSGAETASDASGDLALTKGATKTKGKGKAKDGDGSAKKTVKKKPAAKKGSDAEDGDEDKHKAKPKPKPKPKAKKGGSDEEAMDVDGEEKVKAKPKPKPKAPPAASSSKPKPKDDEVMDVDEEKEKPRPKPKPKKKDADADTEPPKKKLKKTED